METTKKKVPHTQGEWRADGTSLRSKNPKIGFDACLLGSLNRPKEEREALLKEAAANAQRIVKCVNMHDELVSKLKDALGFVQYKAPDLAYQIEQLIKQA